MSIPHKAHFFWGRGTVFPYVRYLTLAFARIQHPDWPLYLYRCTCSDDDKWGAIFQDFQFNGDELNKCFQKSGIEYSPEDKESIKNILLPKGEPAPWDRIRYDSEEIITLLAENSDSLMENLRLLVKTREEREAKRPSKHDYIQDAVERLGVELREYEPKDARVYSMPPPNVSDIFSVEILDKEGGWYFDVDQVILRSFEPLSRVYDFVTCGQTALYIGVFGSRQGGAIVRDFYDKMLGSYSKEHYNSTGITALQNKCFGDDVWFKWFKNNGQVNHNLEQDHFYPLLAHNGASRFWSGEFDIENCTSEAVHYYGGHALSNKACREKNPGNIMEGNDCMARYLRKLTNNGNNYRKEFCL